MSRMTSMADSCLSTGLSSNLRNQASNHDAWLRL